MFESCVLGGSSFHWLNFSRNKYQYIGIQESWIRHYSELTRYTLICLRERFSVPKKVLVVLEIQAKIRIVVITYRRRQKPVANRKPVRATSQNYIKFRDMSYEEFSELEGYSTYFPSVLATTKIWQILDSPHHILSNLFTMLYDRRVLSKSGFLGIAGLAEVAR